AIELALFHHRREHVEAAAEALGERERDVDHAEQERDLAEPPAAHGAETIDERPHAEELDADAEELRQREQHERGAILHLRAHRGGGEAEIEVYGVAHAQPPCRTRRRWPRATSPRPSSTSASVHPAWRASTAKSALGGRRPM